MTEHELDVVEAMDRFGGSFVRALANAFYHADFNNFKKLKNAFSDYWNNYEKVVNEGL